MKILELIKTRTLVIAEIGCNHNGELSLAMGLVKAAAAAGADVAKFQSFSPEEMITENAPKALYQIKATGMKESQYQRLCRHQLSRKDHEELIAFCDQNGITFCSSVFDRDSAEMLYELNVPFFKVPSGEITNLPLLEQIGSYRKPVVLSTGMANLGEVEEALDAIGKVNRNNVVLLHCVSEYPAKWEDANLRAIQTIRDAFHLPVGFSDHTEGIEMSLVAVSMGALVIEKHITFDKNMEGGDHKASLEPHEFKVLINKIRKLEKALGDGIKRCMQSERNIRNVARKSVVAKKNIKKGQTIRIEDLVIKRPGMGIPPKFLKKLIGSRAKVKISADNLIEWCQIDLG